MGYKWNCAGVALAGVSLHALIGPMTQAERSKGRYMRAPDDPPAAPAAAAAPSMGGVADILTPPADAPPAAPPADAPPAGDPEWLGQFSADGGDADNPSHRDWLKAKGFKTVDDLAKSYREAEHALRNGSKLTVPGENAKPEEIAAFNKAIGVPEKPEGYEVKLPDGVTAELLDMDLINSLKAKAHASGTPAKAFGELVNGVIQDQLDTLEKMKVAENGSRDEVLKEWGAAKDAKMADVQNAMRALNLNATDVSAMQRGFALQYGEPGSRKTLELLQKLGAGLAEDTLLGGDGPRRFGVTGEQAQAEINKLIVDKDFQSKLTAKDPDAVARWTRLNGAVAADRDRKERLALGG
jgi:hypothetical protein